MANKTATLYIRSASGFALPPKNLVDLHIGETFYVIWYEGTRKRMRSAGRDAGVAHIMLGNVQTDLRRGTVPQPGMQAQEERIAEANAAKPATVLSGSLADAVVKFLCNSRDRVGKDGYGFARKSVGAYVGRLRFLLEFDQGAALSAANYEYLKGFLSFLRGKEDMSDRYAYNVLQTTVTCLRAQGVDIDDQILTYAGMGKPKLVVAFKPDEVLKFLAACTPEEELRFEFFLHSMGREQEVANTEVADLLLDVNQLHIQPKPHRGFRLKGKKGGQAVKGRKVPMPINFMARLREYTKGMRPHDLIFPNTEGRVEGYFLRTAKKIAERAGLEAHVDLHKFRKTGATQACKDGVSVPIISKWLGHEDLAVTIAYLDIQDSADECYVDARSNGTYGMLLAPGGTL
jgi:integrase